MKPTQQISYRRILVWGLLILFLWLVVSRFTALKKLLDTLAQGQWQWVLLAAGLQVVYYLIYTEQYRAAFSTVDVKSRLVDLLPVMFGSIFVNVAAPTGGASGAALFVDDAARRGESGTRAAVGTLLSLVVDYSSFAIILVFGLLYLFLQHDLKPYEVATALILFLLTLGMAGVVLLGILVPARLHDLLSWMQAITNRLGRLFRRPELLDDAWVEARSAEFSEAAVAITTHPDRLARTLGVALAAQIVNITSLYTLFLAFQNPVSPGVLVAGYAMGILFWIVSLTPQGIGVVEGIMTLVFTSLGVPAERATIITLSFRGLTFWLPLVIGFFTVRRLRSFGGETRSRASVWPVRLAASATALMGLVNVWSAVTPSLPGRVALLAGFSPLEVRHGGHLTSALAGFALLVLAGNLWRRKRVAWQLTLLVLLISIVSHLLKGLDYEEAALAAGLVVWLIALRPQFHARSDPPSLQQGLRVLGLAIIFTLGYGTLGFYLLDRQYSVNFGLLASIRQTLVMFTQFYNPGLTPVTRFGRYFASSIYAIGGISMGYALLLLLRPILARELASPEDRARAETIVKAYGRSTLARFALLPDKAYFFSSGGSVVAYTVKGRTAVALGDPIGPQGDAAAAIGEFRVYCERNDWQPVFYQTLPDYLDLYQQAGFLHLCIGEDAIVDVASFSMEGRGNKGLRSGVNRLVRLNYQAEVIQPPLSDELLQVLREISDSWLAQMHGREKRFSLGWFENEYIRNGPVIVIRTGENRIVAFANILPEYQLNEITIDLMRRIDDAEHGVMDFLFASLIQWAAEQGYDTLNLGLSALSGVGEAAGDPAVERVLHYVYEHINQFYNFKGLHEFKEKFHPRWSPRYLVYPSPASLIPAWIATVRADAGDTLVEDTLRDLLERRLSKGG